MIQNTLSIGQVCWLYCSCKSANLSIDLPKTCYYLTCSEALLQYIHKAVQNSAKVPSVRAGAPSVARLHKILRRWVQREQHSSKTHNARVIHDSGLPAIEQGMWLLGTVLLFRQALRAFAHQENTMLPQAKTLISESSNTIRRWLHKP